MADIFNNPYKNTETWAVQGATLSWAKGTAITNATATADRSLTAADNRTGGDVPLIVLGVQIQYARRLQAYYPINTDKKINIVAAPQGTLQVTSVLGPTGIAIDKFIKAVAAECKDTNSQVYIALDPFGNSTCTTTATGGSATNIAQNMRFIMSGVELETLGVQMQGGEGAVCNMPLTFSFTGLDLVAKQRQP